MMRLALLSFLLILLPPAEPLPGRFGQRDDSGRVEGFVVRSGTSTPVTRAAVVLRSADNDNGIRSTGVTDGSGKFAFSNVPPGIYQLSASRDGYVSGAYGEERQGGAGASFAVRASELIGDINIGLVPTGVVSGYIEDRYGQPVVGATVSALQFSYEGRNRNLSEVRNTTTNDRGEYRLYWLEAGEYLVSVLPRNNLPIVETVVFGFNAAGRPPPRIETSGVNRTEMFVPVYYPGSVDPSFASAIDVGPGIDYAGVSMRIVEVPTLRVRGRVVDGVGGAPTLRTTVRLIGSSTVTGPQRQPTDVADSDETFELIGVIPGAYELVATSSGSRNAGLGPLDQSRPEGNSQLFARFPIDIGNADIDNITVPMSPGFSLSGRVYVEPAARQQPVTVSDVRVALAAAGRIRYGVSIQPMSPAPDGTFQIEGIPPNVYDLDIRGLPPKAYLKEARLGAQEILDSGLRLMGAWSGELSLLVAQDAGTVTASVVDARDQPVSGVRAVLIPEPSRRGRLDLYKVTRTDGGTASFDGVVPGDYKLFAWEQVPNGAWRNAEFLREYEDLGEAVHVSSFGSASATVRVVPAP